jgi:hypothetical protein
MLTLLTPSYAHVISHANQRGLNQGHCEGVRGGWLKMVEGADEKSRDKADNDPVDSRHTDTMFCGNPSTPFSD